MLTLSVNHNPNYICKLFQIKTLVPIMVKAKDENNKIIKNKFESARTIQSTTIDFQNVVTSLEAKVNDWYVYFPIESEINFNFLKNTNSFRHSQLNLNTNSVGFFEDNCRVKCCTLAGQKSMGYIVPLEVLENYFNQTVSREEQYFDTIGPHLLVKKYVNKNSKLPRNVIQTKHDKKAVKVHVKEGQFKFHSDTENLRHNIYNLKETDKVSITHKIHGTSFVLGNLEHDFKLSWFKSFLNRFLKLSTTYYDYVISSRKVIKSKNSDPGFYSEDIWKIVAKEIQNQIPKGFTVYGEIAGYLPSGSMIQNHYDYGNEIGKHSVHIYRVTNTNSDGVVLELSSLQCQLFCEQVGLNFVPVLAEGVFKDVIEKLYQAKPLYDGFTYLEAIQESSFEELAIQVLESTYNDKNCYMCSNKVPEEGIVLRKENNWKLNAYKLKSFNFLKFESKQADVSATNLEDS